MGTKFIYDNDVLVGCYNVWQEKVVALSIPGCSAWLKCPKCTSDTVELPIWFQVNKLSLNVAKTNFMIFGNKRFEENYMISINGMNVNRVYMLLNFLVFILIPN